MIYVLYKSNVPICKKFLDKNHAQLSHTLDDGKRLFSIEADEMPRFFQGFIDTGWAEIVGETEAMQMMGMDFEVPEVVDEYGIKCPHCGGKL